MTADDPSLGRAAASPDGSAAPWAAAAPEPLAGQVDRIARDLATHRWLLAGGDALAWGAALAAAHGALVLATAPLASRPDRDLRHAALGALLPALTGVGLGHVAALVEAALAFERHPATGERPDGALQ